MLAFVTTVLRGIPQRIGRFGIIVVFEPFIDISLFVSFFVVGIGGSIFAEINDRIFDFGVGHRKFVRELEFFDTVDQVDISADNFPVGFLHDSADTVIAGSDTEQETAFSSFDIEGVFLIDSHP